MFTFIPPTPCKYWGWREFIRKRNLVIQIVFAYIVIFSYNSEILLLKHTNILA